MRCSELDHTISELECEVCGFDFEVTYGELGKNFAECHHKVPVAKLTPKSKTKLSDLAIVCELS